MFSLPQLSFWLAALFTGVSAAGSFLEPRPTAEPGVYTNNTVFKINDTVNAKWTTDLSIMDIVVFQQHPATNPWVVKVINQSLTQERQTTWKVNLTGFNLPDGEDMVLFFGVASEPTPTGPNWLPNLMDSTSGYFNVSVPVTTTTTNLPTASQTQTPAVQAVPHGLSKGATAGIAVGTIASILIISVLGFLAWRHFWKNRYQTDIAGGLLGANIDKLNIEDSPVSILEMPAQNAIYEVSGWNQRMAQELPTQSRDSTQAAPSESFKGLAKDFHTGRVGG